MPVEIAGTFFWGSFVHGSIKSSILEEVQLIFVLLLTDRGWRIGSAHSTMVHFYRDLVSSDLATCCDAVALPSLDDFQLTGIFVGIPGL